MKQINSPDSSSQHEGSLYLQALIDVIDTAEDGISLLDGEGRFLYLNPQHVRIFGYEDQSELIGGTWHQLYNEKEVKWFESYVMPQFAAKGYWRGECTARKANGELFEEDVWLKALPDGNMACFCRDITQMKEVERQTLFNLKLQQNLEEIEERLLLFTSHELRAPLGGIGLIADYLSEYHETLDKEDITKHVLQISGFVAEFRELLDRFRVFSTTKESTMRAVDICEVDLVELLEKVSSLTAKRYERGTTFRVSADSVATMISTDQSILRHIIQNLLSNAAKYSPPDSVVDIDVKKEDNFIKITITDTGIGIPEEEQKKIMEFMYRASNSKGTNGSGVGLALVKQCLETLKGTIDINSEVDRGTCVSITLPLLHEHN